LLKTNLEEENLKQSFDQIPPFSSKDSLGRSY